MNLQFIGVPLKITREKEIDLQAVLLVELEEDDLGKYLESGYKKAVQRVNIPGFRKGKVPRSMLEQYIGKEGLLNEVLDSMMPQVTSEAVASQDLNPSSYPQIEIISMDPFNFKATVPLQPEVKLNDYTSVRIPLNIPETTDQDIETQIKQLQERSATWKPAEREAKLDDLVTISAIGSVEGETKMDENDVVFLMDPQSNRPMPGFVEALVGSKVDESKTFDIDIPQDFPDESIAGKEMNFNVSVSEIKERDLPELDDEFAKTVGDGHESFDALRKSVKNDLILSTETQTKREYQNSVIDSLIELAEFNFPPLLIEHEIAHIKDERDRLFQQMNIRVDDYLKSINKTPEEMENDVKEEAATRIKQSYLMRKISESENIEPTDDLVEERIKEYIQENQSEQNPIEETDDLRESIHRSLISELTIEKLVSIASSNEITNPSQKEDGPVNDDKKEKIDNDD